MRALVPHFRSARRLLQAGGPYLLLELLLPGGTLIALLLFLYRRKGSRLAGFVQRTGAGRVLRSVTEQIMLPLDVYAWAQRMDTRCTRQDDGLAALDFAPGCRPACPVRRPSPSRAARRRAYARGEVIAVH